MSLNYRNVKSATGKLFKAGGNKGGIQVKKVGKNYRLTYTTQQFGKQTFVLSETGFESMLNRAEGFNSTESFFKSAYWETDAGKLQKEQNVRENFGKALQHYTEVDPNLRRYVRNLYNSMSDQARSQFIKENYIFVEEVFHYEEERNEITGEWEQTKKDQTAELQEIARRLEMYASEDQIKFAKSVQSKII